MTDFAITQLADFLDKPGAEMYSPRGVELQIATIKEMNNKLVGGMAIVANRRTVDLIGPTACAELFSNLTKVFRKNCQLEAYIVLLKTEHEVREHGGETMFGEDAIKAIQGLCAGLNIVIITEFEEVAKSMSTLVHLLAAQRKESAS